MGIDFQVEVTVTPEARIIAEDTTYAVIALRIEKAWLTRNIHFLAALADRATVATISIATPTA